MKKFLRKQVDKNQNAFVPNMHIHDNISLPQELLKGYERKEGPKRVAIKIDIQKAYDTVNWKFLECILHGRGLRQDDPVSSYLVTLLMEILSLIVQEKVDDLSPNT
ncbi:RNA-directed DNA polymerase, eukaryota, reverse transcriptase zinc-binding domain protein, partial [Tanacetum coccineum]